jgi:hypothetical protein
MQGSFIISAEISLKHFKNELEQEEIALLLLAARNCAMCDEIKRALKTVRNVDWPFSHYTLNVPNSTADLNEIVNHFKIAGFPAFVLLKFGAIQRRWVGFFEDDPVENRPKLLQDFMRNLAIGLGEHE